jgi:hypothetical protein
MNEEYVPEHILTGGIVGRRPDVKGFALNSSALVTNFSMSYIISGKDRGCITYLSGVKPLAAEVSFPDVELNADGRAKKIGRYDKSRNQRSFAAASMRGRVKKYEPSGRSNEHPWIDRLFGRDDPNRWRHDLGQLHRRSKGQAAASEGASARG